MALHRAYGRDLESLDVVVVDDAKPMQTILRSILHSAHVGRVRTFDAAEPALQSMMIEPPHLLVTDWHMRPVDGLTLMRAMRRRQMGPLALVPTIMITAHPTRALVEAALETGAHFVVAKPMSPATLLKRIAYILQDPREFLPGDDDRELALEGQSSRIAREKERLRQAVGAPQAAAAEPSRPVAADPLPEPRSSGFAAVQRGRARDAGHGAGGEA